jgi:serine/threonine-protein kinase
MSDLPPRPPASRETDFNPAQADQSVLPLLMVDQQERWSRGERVLVESYLEKWPLVRADQERALDLIYHEFLLREQRGEAPDPAEYGRRFPHWAEPLRLLFEVHRAMPPTAAGAAPEDLRPRCTLTVVKGPHRGQRLDADRHRTVLVGRGSLAELRLADDAHVSRHHCLLELNPPRCYLRDLGSRNGTYVNAEKITERFLQDGDMVAVGQTQLHFAVEGGRNTPTLAATGTAPAAPRAPAALLPVPGYDVVRLLGQGGMGAVYLARRQATGEQVALKVIVPESAANETTLRRFLREINVLSQLHHPRIVRLHDMGVAAGQVFFAMEYVEAVPLEDDLAARPAEERTRLACALVCQALEGLAHAHERSFVHRDIKPSNLLVSRRGDDWQAKLGDFGLAKNFASAGLSGVTYEGQALGTYAFMAPEQVLDARQATPAVDIYAAGATLYRLIAGAYAHDFERKVDPLLVVLESPPVPLRGRCPAVSRALAEVVERALAHDPGQRFGTAEAMLQALLPHAAGAV